MDVFTTMKNFILLIIIGIWASLTPVQAQYNAPRPPNTDQFLKQVQRQQALQWQQQQSMNNLLRNNVFSYGNKKKIKNLHLFKIVYADSTEEQVFCHLEFTQVSHTLVVETGKHREISPVQTLYISRMFKRGELKGWANDSCWLFKTTQGRINAYSSEAVANTKKILFIQKGDSGEKQVCTPENLAVLVADNAEALAAAQQKRYLTAILIYNRQ